MRVQGPIGASIVGFLHACSANHAIRPPDASGPAEPPRCGAFAPPPLGLDGRQLVVSPTGNDSNDGSELRPLRTIQAAADRVEPGDTVTVEDGTYTSTDRAIVRVARGGTSQAWVWFRARNRGGAHLTSSTSIHGFAISDGAGFVRIEGFEISGLEGATGASGIHAETGGHDSEFIGNYIHDIGHACTDTTFGIDGVYIHQPGVRVEANRITDIGRLGPGESGCEPEQPFWENHDHGVYVNGMPRGASDDTTIVNNVFDRIEHGWGVHLYPGSIDRLTVAFNTFVGANPNRNGALIHALSRLADTSIVANAFVGPRGSAIFVQETDPDAINVTAVDNVTTTPVLMSNAVGAEGTPPQNVVNAVISVDAEGRPGPASPLVDGTASTLTDRDFDACPRPAGTRVVGAFESAARP